MNIYFAFEFFCLFCDSPKALKVDGNAKASKVDGNATSDPHLILKTFLSTNHNLLYLGITTKHNCPISLERNNLGNGEESEEERHLIESMSNQTHDNSFYTRVAHNRHFRCDVIC